MFVTFLVCSIFSQPFSEMWPGPFQIFVGTKTLHLTSKLWNSSFLHSTDYCLTPIKMFSQTPAGPCHISQMVQTTRFKRSSIVVRTTAMFYPFLYKYSRLHPLWKIINFSTLDKQCICVNTQLKSSKKQLKWNVCVPKSNSNDRYAITCGVIAYHLVHFVSIRLINKCQSGIDFIFTSEPAIYSSFMKISLPSPVFRGKTLRWKWNFAKYTLSNDNKGMRFALGTIKSASWYFRKADDGSD